MPIDDINVLSGAANAIENAAEGTDGSGVNSVSQNIKTEPNSGTGSISKMLTTAVTTLSGIQAVNTVLQSTPDGGTSTVKDRNFLNGLFNIPKCSSSVKELMEKYPTMSFASLHSLMTAITGESTMEQILRDINFSQQKQKNSTDEMMRSLEGKNKMDLEKSLGSGNEALSAKAGIGANGQQIQIEGILPGWVKYVVLAVVAAAVVATGIGFGALPAILALGCSITLFPLVSKIISSITMDSDSKFTRGVCEFFELFDISVSISELAGDIAEACGANKETVEKIKQYVKLAVSILGALAQIIASVAIMATGIGAGAGTAMMTFTIASILSGMANSVVAIVDAVNTLRSSNKKKDIAEQEFKFSQLAAYCEKLKKDLELISSEIEMLVELFSGAIEKVRAEYNRIASMISDTKETDMMIARNIGA